MLQGAGDRRHVRAGGGASRPQARVWEAPIKKLISDQTDPHTNQTTNTSVPSGHLLDILSTKHIIIMLLVAFLLPYSRCLVVSISLRAAGRVELTIMTSVLRPVV